MLHRSLRHALISTTVLTLSLSPAAADSAMSSVDLSFPVAGSGAAPVSASALPGGQQAAAGSAASPAGSSALPWLAAGIGAAVLGVALSSSGSGGGADAPEETNDPLFIPSEEITNPGPRPPRDPALGLAAATDNDSDTPVPDVPPRYFIGLDRHDGTPGPVAGGSRASFETPEYMANWGLDHINAAARYAEGASGKGVLLGVFDTGIAQAHPDVGRDKVAPGSFTYYRNSSDVRDDHGHGTHVGTIIAGARNGRGTHGVAPDADLLVFQNLGRDGVKMIDTDDAFEDQFYRAVETGAFAVNHSWSYVRFIDMVSIDEFDSYEDAHPYLTDNHLRAMLHADQEGVVQVFAAGNQAESEVSVLAGVPKLVEGMADTWFAVVAIDENDQIADFSAHCGMARQWCIAAPGVNVRAGVPGRDWAEKSGTSMAAPHVTGSLGLLKSQFPELTGPEAAQILRETARDIGEPGVDAIYGHGALDLEEAVRPQGEITVQTAPTLDAAEMPLSDSVIAARGAGGAALAETLSGTVMMVTDRYNRGYGVDMGALAVEDTTMPAARQAVVASFARTGGTRDAGALRVSRTGLAGLDGTLAADGFSVLGGTGAVLETRAQTGLGTLSLAGSLSDADTSATRLRYEMAGAGGRMAVSLGEVREDGRFLGTDLGGVFSGTTTTRYVSVSGAVEVARDLDLTLGAGGGISEMASETGILSISDARSRTFSLGMDARDVTGRGDRLSIGLSRDLDLDGGQVAMARPVGLGASTRAERNTDVAFARETTEMDGAPGRSWLSLGYGMPIGGESGHIGAGVTLDPASPDRVSGSLGYKIRF